MQIKQGSNYQGKGGVKNAIETWRWEMRQILAWKTAKKVFSECGYTMENKTLYETNSA